MKVKLKKPKDWQSEVQTALNDAREKRKRLEEFLAKKSITDLIEKYQMLQRAVADSESHAVALMRNNSKEFSERGRGVFNYEFEGYSATVTNPVEYDVDALLEAVPKLHLTAKIKRSITAPEIERLINTGVLDEKIAKRFSTTGTPRISLKMDMTDFGDDE